MTEMKIEDYLAQGGKLTNPSNVPARYRAELMRLMATFVDSELAGAAGFADVINAGPGIKERIAAAKIVMEKTDNADKVLKIMGEFGANTEKYANHHPWADRLPRDADIGTNRTDGDMRLAVFNYPLAGWSDAVVMNLLMGLAVGVQMKEFTQVSYAPLAEAFREIAPIEARHAELAAEGLERLEQRHLLLHVLHQFDDAQDEVGGDQHDLIGAAFRLGRVKQRGHVRAATRNQDRDPRLIHCAWPTSLRGRSSCRRCP